MQKSNKNSVLIPHHHILLGMIDIIIIILTAGLYLKNRRDPEKTHGIVTSMVSYKTW